MGLNWVLKVLKGKEGVADYNCYMYYTSNVEKKNILCCSERVMLNTCNFQVRSELTQVQGSYKASKYCDKYINTHPHASVGPAGACE